MSEIQLPKGISLSELAIRRREIDLLALLGDTKALVFRDTSASNPLYVTPEDGVLPQVAPHETSVFTWEGAPEVGDLGAAVVVPLTPTHKNLYEDQVLVGRSLSNDIRLVSPQVSKVHVRFDLDEGRWQITDLGSSNGTRLNGLKLEPKRGYFLRPGDEIALGDVSVHYLDAEGLLDLVAILPPA